MTEDAGVTISAEHVARALRDAAAVDAERIRISVLADGVVALDGAVRTYAEKCIAAEVAETVDGVAGVRNRLEVRLTIADYRTDGTLERVIRELFEFLSRMPPEMPRATVLRGWVTLEGNVPHPFQKKLLENAVREIAGVRGITNNVRVTPSERRRTEPAARAE